MDIAALSKKERRAYADGLARESREFPRELQQQEIPLKHRGGRLKEVWRSKYLHVQVWEGPPGIERLSVNRTSLNVQTGHWRDGITWEELMEVKRQVGRGDKDAVEILPRDEDIVNVANMRHIWVINDGIAWRWKAKKGDAEAQP